MPDKSSLLDDDGHDPMAVLNAAVGEIRSVEGRHLRALRALAEIEVATETFDPSVATASRIADIFTRLRCDLDTPDLTAYRRALAAAREADAAKRSKLA